MKLKTKTGPIGTECREVGPGRWRFTTGKFQWEWTGSPGLNLYVALADSDGFAGILYAKNLDHAVMFAQGYEVGHASK
jgi:hypothetical protein